MSKQQQPGELKKRRSLLDLFSQNRKNKTDEDRRAANLSLDSALPFVQSSSTENNTSSIHSLIWPGDDPNIPNLGQPYSPGFFDRMHEENDENSTKKASSSGDESQKDTQSSTSRRSSGSSHESSSLSSSPVTVQESPKVQKAPTRPSPRIEDLTVDALNDSLAMIDDEEKNKNTPNARTAPQTPTTPETPRAPTSFQGSRLAPIPEEDDMNRSISSPITATPAQNTLVNIPANGSAHEQASNPLILNFSTIDTSELDDIFTSDVVADLKSQGIVLGGGELAAFEKSFSAASQKPPSFELNFDESLAQQFLNSTDEQAELVQMFDEITVPAKTPASAPLTTNQSSIPNAPVPVSRRGGAKKSPSPEFIEGLQALNESLLKADEFIKDEEQKKEASTVNNVSAPAVSPQPQSPATVPTSAKEEVIEPVNTNVDTPSKEPVDTKSPSLSPVLQEIPHTPVVSRVADNTSDTPPKDSTPDTSHLTLEQQAESALKAMEAADASRSTIPQTPRTPVVDRTTGNTNDDSATKGNLTLNTTLEEDAEIILDNMAAEGITTPYTFHQKQPQAPVAGRVADSTSNSTTVSEEELEEAQTPGESIRFDSDELDNILTQDVVTDAIGATLLEQTIRRQPVDFTDPFEALAATGANIGTPVVHEDVPYTPVVGDAKGNTTDFITFSADETSARTISTSAEELEEAQTPWKSIRFDSDKLDRILTPKVVADAIDATYMDQSFTQQPTNVDPFEELAATGANIGAAVVHQENGFYTPIAGNATGNTNTPTMEEAPAAPTATQNTSSSTWFFHTVDAEGKDKEEKGNGHNNTLPLITGLTPFEMESVPLETDRTARPHRELLESGKPDAIYQEGIAEKERGKLEIARELLRQAGKLYQDNNNPKDAALSYLEAGEYQQAVGQYQALNIKEQPQKEKAELYYQQGRAYTGAGKAKEKQAELYYEQERFFPSKEQSDGSAKDYGAALTSFRNAKAFAKDAKNPSLPRYRYAAARAEQRQNNSVESLSAEKNFPKASRTAGYHHIDVFRKSIQHGQEPSTIENAPFTTVVPGYEEKALTTTGRDLNPQEGVATYKLDTTENRILDLEQKRAALSNRKFAPFRKSQEAKLLAQIGELRMEQAYAAVHKGQKEESQDFFAQAAENFKTAFALKPDTRLNRFINASNIPYAHMHYHAGHAAINLANHLEKTLSQQIKAKSPEDAQEKTRTKKYSQYQQADTHFTAYEKAMRRNWHTVPAETSLQQGNAKYHLAVDAITKDSTQQDKATAAAQVKQAITYYEKTNITLAKQGKPKLGLASANIAACNLELATLEPDQKETYAKRAENFSKIALETVPQWNREERMRIRAISDAAESPAPSTKTFLENYSQYKANREASKTGKPLPEASLGRQSFGILQTDSIGQQVAKLDRLKQNHPKHSEKLEALPYTQMIRRLHISDPYFSRPTVQQQSGKLTDEENSLIGKKIFEQGLLVKLGNTFATETNYQSIAAFNKDQVATPNSFTNAVGVIHNDFFGRKLDKGTTIANFEQSNNFSSPDHEAGQDTQRTLTHSKGALINLVGKDNADKPIVAQTFNLITQHFPELHAILPMTDKSLTQEYAQFAKQGGALVKQDAEYPKKLQDSYTFAFAFQKQLGRFLQKNDAVNRDIVQLLQFATEEVLTRSTGFRTTIQAINPDNADNNRRLAFSQARLNKGAPTINDIMASLPSLPDTCKKIEAKGVKEQASFSRSPSISESYDTDEKVASNQAAVTRSRRAIESAELPDDGTPWAVTKVIRPKTETPDKVCYSNGKFFTSKERKQTPGQFYLDATEDSSESSSPRVQRRLSFTEQVNDQSRTSSRRNSIETKEKETKEKGWVLL